jgi:hypothetical protein
MFYIQSGGCEMILQHMKAKDYAKAIGVGIGTGVLLSLIMVPAARAGISPMPKPLGLAFAQCLLGKVPLPVGILFHIAYVTLWSVLYVIAFQRRTFFNALWLALGLWALVLIVFYPLVGWGFLGLAVSPKLIVASLVLHILFAICVWGLSRLAFPVNAQDRLARA